MTSNGKTHIPYKPLPPASGAPRNARAPCTWCKTSLLRQAVIAALLIGVFVLVIYQSARHTRQPSDVFHGLADGPALLRAGDGGGDEVWDKIRIKHTKRRLPQCLIVGIRKAGTRALLTFLNLHPQIQTAKNEVHFFDEDENYARGYDWYRKRMPYSFTGQITLEKSPAYFKVRDVPQRVLAMNASIKLLLIVRDPTERAISDYLQLHIKRLAHGKPSESFELLAMTSEGEVNEDYSVLRLSLYYKHMRNWLKHFTLEHFHFVDGDDLTRNPVGELRRVESFLGLEHRLDDDMFYFNKSKKHYCYRQGTEQRCLDQSKGREHPDIDPAVIHKLRKYFRPFNEKFFAMIGRKFDWPVD